MAEQSREDPARHTVASFAALEGVSTTTVRRWIRDGKLRAPKVDGAYVIPIDDNINFIVDRLRERYGKPPEPWIPEELKDYAEWHTVLDEFVWLLKVTYSSREDLQRRQFRLDRIFASYLIRLGPDLVQIRGAFRGNAGVAPAEVISDLRRGWYNELAYSFPMRASTLGLSFRDVEANKTASAERMLFPSWRFIQAYYAVYYYIRTLTRQKFGAFRIEQHTATLAAFKNNVSSVLDEVLWAWPLNMGYVPRRRILRAKLPVSTIQHLQWQYARHPRAPHRTPLESFEFVLAEFKRRGRSGKRPTAYNLLDYLYDFRVWANYQDIENILKLWSPGYRTIVDMNLAVIVFLTGGVAELAVLAQRGEAEYRKQLQSFYDTVATGNTSIAEAFGSVPLYQRFEIYRTLGLVSEPIKLKAEPRPHAVDHDWLANFMRQ